MWWAAALAEVDRLIEPYTLYDEWALALLAMTERADYRFTVKEYSDGEPWIMLEPMWASLPVLAGGFLGLDLREGTSYDDAHQLADVLNEKVKAVSYTP